MNKDEQKRKEDLSDLESVELGSNTKEEDKIYKYSKQIGKDNYDSYEPIKGSYVKKDEVILEEENKDLENKSKDKEKDKSLKILINVLLIILLFSILFLLASITAKKINSSWGDLPFFKSSSEVTNGNGPTLQINDNTEEDSALTASKVYEKVEQSIVGVVSYNPSRGLVSEEGARGGTGIIMSADGYVITNAHVIGNTNKSNVTVVQGEKEYPANVVGMDIRTDLAVLKINTNALKAAEFGNSDKIAVGEWVLAIGNPGGLGLSNTLTRGIVSAKNRSLGSSSSLVKYIQTDAAVNPGNSGGALLNMHGQVVGINAVKASDKEGIGFSIPSNLAKSVIDDIIKKGYVQGRVKLGISIKSFSAYEAQLYNVPQGVLISEISAGSDLANKDVRAGDIITKIDGINVLTTDALFGELIKHKPGDSVNLTIYRPAINSKNSTSFDVRVLLLEDKGEIK